MRDRPRAVGGVVVLLVAIVAGAGARQSPNSELPRTPWGHPDLQGF